MYLDHCSLHKKMPKRCVVYGCSNTTDKENNIYLYRIPFWDENVCEAVKRREKWVDFVRWRRDKWTPTRSSVVCSKHFTSDCFEYGSATVEKYKTAKLKRDEFSVCVSPTLQTSQVPDSTESKHTKRIKQRKVRCLYSLINILGSVHDY